MQKILSSWLDRLAHILSFNLQQLEYHNTVQKSKISDQYSIIIVGSWMFGIHFLLEGLLINFVKLIQFCLLHLNTCYTLSKLDVQPMVYLT